MILRVQLHGKNVLTVDRCYLLNLSTAGGSIGKSSSSLRRFSIDVARIKFEKRTSVSK